MENLILNTDSQPIKNWEESRDGYMKLWLSIGVPNQDLNYDGNRIEFIDKADLINPESINTAVGRPVVLNHPPVAVTANQFNNFAGGVSLQEYAQDSDGTVYMASVLWDDKLKSGVRNKEYTHTSSAYYATKTPNLDGKIKQTNRKYDHFAILSPEYTPKAGAKSKVLLLNMDSTTPSTSVINPMNLDAEVKTRTELWVDWLPILKEKGKTIDYNLDSRAIKKAVLSCFYPEQTINQLNVDSLLDGFWLNFVANPNPLNPKNPVAPANAYSFNTDGDDPVEAERQKYIDAVSGKKSA